MTHGFFISYCSQDREFAQRLVQDIPVWFDEAELEPGDSIIQKIVIKVGSRNHLNPYALHSLFY